MRKVALDCETTGLDPEVGHRIIEIGCVEINERAIGYTYHSLINPQRQIDSDSIKIHSITDETVKDSPLFQDIWGELLDFIKDSELIIHNALFDLSFLDAELKRMKLPSLLEATGCTVTDTLELARSLHPSQRNSLDALSDRHGISREQRKDRHGALIDADLLAQVYLAMTGSQVAMSFSSDEVKNTESDMEKVQFQEELPVIRANGDDIHQHEELLKWIAEKSDNGVHWGTN